MDLFGRKKLKKSILNLTKICGELVEEKNNLINEKKNLEKEIDSLESLLKFHFNYEDTHGLIFPCSNKLDEEEFKILKEKLAKFLSNCEKHVEYLPGQHTYCLTSKDKKYLTIKKETYNNDLALNIIRFSFFDDDLPNSQPTYSMTFVWNIVPNTHTEDKEIMEYFEKLIEFIDDMILQCNKCDEHTIKEKPSKPKKQKKNKSKKKK